MQVRAKIMVFDGLRRVRPNQICEIDDSLVVRDADGIIIKPRWAADVNEPLPIPATSPYPKKLPEVSPSVIKAVKPPLVDEPAVAEKPRKGRRLLGSDNVI